MLNFFCRLGKKVVNSTSEQQEVSWSGPAEFKHHAQILECRVEQKHPLPWNHKKSVTRLLNVQCKQVYNNYLILPSTYTASTSYTNYFEILFCSFSSFRELKEVGGGA
jgi:hypothetical protein